MKLQYLTCCVNATGSAIQKMVDQATDVTYETLAKRCDIKEFQKSMGYGADLKLKDDWAVSFHRSKYCGKKCYYIRHSSIEYIWT